MTDLDQLVASTLRDRAGDAPSEVRDLADGARALHGRRRRRRTVAAVTATAAAVAAAVVIPLSLIDGDGAPAPVTTPPPTTAPTPARTQAVAFHGVEIDVPAAWSINEEMCGTPTADTVLRDVTVVLSCLRVRPEGISTVELRTGRPDWGPRRNVVTATNAQGTRLEGAGGRFYVREAGVMVDVNVTHPALREQIIDSIRVVDVDSNGCRMHGVRQTLPFRYGGGIDLDPALVPGNPDRVAICKYTGTWLTASSTVTGAALHELLRVVDDLPDGFVRADPEYYLPSVCDEPDESSRFVLHVLDADGSGRTLWARIGVCGNLGITDGQHPHALTPELAAALNGPLHTPYAFQGHLIPAR
jgi:hypothetical protein